MGLVRFATKVAWKTSKFAVKHVVVPIAISAATAVVLNELAERIRAGAPAPNGKVDAVIRPEP